MADEATREDLLLRSMADLANEFQRFRENTAERLARLERKPRRSEDGDDFGRWIPWMVFVVTATLIAPLLIEFFARLRKKENADGGFSLPQA